MYPEKSVPVGGAFMPMFVLSHLPKSSIKELHSFPYKQPGPVSTLIYIAVGWFG